MNRPTLLRLLLSYPGRQETRTQLLHCQDPCPQLQGSPRGAQPGPYDSHLLVLRSVRRLGPEVLLSRAEGGRRADCNTVYNSAHRDCLQQHQDGIMILSFASINQYQHEERGQDWEGILEEMARWVQWMAVQVWGWAFRQ